MPNPLMLFLRQTFKGRNRAVYDPKNGWWVLKIPKVFSFISNPDETLDTLYSLVALSREAQPTGLFIDHTDMKETDMAASALHDLIVINVRNEWRAHGRKYNLGGCIPEDHRMAYGVMCTGLTKSLKIKSLTPPPEMEQQFVKFPLFHGTKAARNSKSTDQEKAATKLALHLDECLQFAGGYRLSDDGKAQIVKWVGEVISNAEEHSDHNDWYAIGYMEPNACRRALCGVRGTQSHRRV